VKDGIEKQPWINLDTATLNDTDAGRIFRLNTNGVDTYYALPQFVIIGVQKSGTRELHTWLCEHPHLTAPKGEVHFFTQVRNVKREWKDYVQVPGFRLSSEDLESISVFEKTPNYFDGKGKQIWSRVPETIHRVLPSGKFIVMLRNPTSRAYSAFNMKAGQPKKSRYLRRIQELRADPTPFVQRRYRRRVRMLKKGITPPCFSDLVSHHLELEQGKTTQKLPPRYRNIFSRGCYVQSLRKWMELFSPDQLYVNTLENWIQHPFDVMNDIQEFLSLDPIDYSQIARQNKRGFWVIKGRPSKGNQKPYPPMNVEDREALDAYYKPWNKLLKAMLPDVPIPW